MSWLWWGAALFAGVVDWLAVARRVRWLEYIFKPLTMILVIIGAGVQIVQDGGSWYQGFFLAAFSLSLAGDVFLMLPDERWFIPGLGSFLVAQLCFIAGLNPCWPAPASAWLLLLIVPLTSGVLRRVWVALAESGQQALRGPVLVYGAVLSLTLFSGWASWWRADWTLQACLAASAGATLFYVSDLMLAWDRFVRRSHVLHVAVIVTYHLAQILLAAVIALT
ncbi:MAG TPA: lysoplasmalogenase [Chloroflexi bacterium]|nr:lysoplasmalogenase [Chloroflexota bacterium]